MSAGNVADLFGEVTEVKANRHYDRDGYSLAEVRAVVVREDAIAPELGAALRSCNSADLAVRFFSEVVTRAPWFDCDKECVVSVFLNRKNKVIGWNCVGQGSVSGCIVHPREVLRAALVAGASSFVLMHNHPSGDPKPSTADVQVTRMMREAAKAIDMGFLDHVIAGQACEDPLGKGYFSFREAGIL